MTDRIIKLLDCIPMRPTARFRLGLWFELWAIRFLGFAMMCFAETDPSSFRRVEKTLEA